LEIDLTSLRVDDQLRRASLTALPAVGTNFAPPRAAASVRDRVRRVSMLACSLPPCAPRWRPEIPSIKWLGPDGAAQNGAESGGNAKLIFRDCPTKKHARARGG